MTTHAFEIVTYFNGYYILKDGKALRTRGGHGTCPKPRLRIWRTRRSAERVVKAMSYGGGA